MFDVSFLELLTIAIVALLVFGPKRLPTLAKRLGHLLGKSRRAWQHIQEDIHQSLHEDDQPPDEQPKA